MAHKDSLTMTITVRVRTQVSFWDALKLRLMGRRPAAVLMWHIVKMVKGGER